MPPKLDIYATMQVYVPKLADSTAIKACDPWLRAMAIALEDQINDALTQIREKQDEDMAKAGEVMRKLRDRVRRLEVGDE